MLEGSGSPAFRCIPRIKSQGFSGDCAHRRRPCLAAERGSHASRVYVADGNLLSLQMQACQPKCSRRPGDTMHWLGMLRLSASVWNATAASGSWPGGGWGLLGSQGVGCGKEPPLRVALGARWVPRADFSLKIPPRVRRAALKECGAVKWKRPGRWVGVCEGWLGVRPMSAPLGSNGHLPGLCLAGGTSPERAGATEGEVEMPRAPSARSRGCSGTALFAMCPLRVFFV